MQIACRVTFLNIDPFAAMDANEDTRMHQIRVMHKNNCPHYSLYVNTVNEFDRPF